MTGPRQQQWLSVIIPVLNESQRIGGVIRRVRTSNGCETIVVDGGSDDDTREIAAREGATVVESALGRGRQMNTGAASARGHSYLFLHADTVLPHGFEKHVAEALEADDVAAGAFGLHIDSPRRAFRLIERAVRFRSRVLHMPYGDQAVFLRATTFQEVGGFPEFPVMEDYSLMRRLRRRGRIKIIDTPVITSARQWKNCGIARTTMINQTCILAYHLGVSPARIAAFRNRCGVGWLI